MTRLANRRKLQTLEKRVGDLERLLAVLWAEREKTDLEEYHSIRAWVVNGTEVRPKVEVIEGIIHVSFAPVDDPAVSIPPPPLSEV